MNADHLKPDKYMKNDKDLTIEELKVRAQPLPSVWAHACGESHLNGEITSGESCIPWGFTALRGWTSTSDHGTRHGTRHLARRSALNNMAPTRLALRAYSPLA